MQGMKSLKLDLLQDNCPALSNPDQELESNPELSITILENHITAELISIILNLKYSKKNAAGAGATEKPKTGVRRYKLCGKDKTTCRLSCHYM